MPTTNSDAENWLRGARDVSWCNVSQRPTSTEYHFPDGSSLTTALNGATVDEIVSVPSRQDGAGASVDVHTRPATDEERERFAIDRTYYTADAVPRGDANVVTNLSDINRGIRIDERTPPVVVEGCKVLTSNELEPIVDNKELRLWALKTARTVLSWDTESRDELLCAPAVIRDAEKLLKFVGPVAAKHGGCFAQRLSDEALWLVLGQGRNAIGELIGTATLLLRFFDGESPEGGAESSALK